jgi:hypothetical protein
MTDHTEQDSSRSFSPSKLEPTISTGLDTSETIAALINGAPIFDPNTINNARDDSEQRTHRRSSTSIIQALVNTSHLLSTNDARKR